MNLKIVIATGVALGLAAAAWFYRGTAPIAGVVRAIGLPGENSTPDTASALKAAGVHKCVGANGTSYADGPCPRSAARLGDRGRGEPLMAEARAFRQD